MLQLVTNQNDESKGRSISIRFGFSTQPRFNITITMFNKGSWTFWSYCYTNVLIISLPNVINSTMQAFEENIKHPCKHYIWNSCHYKGLTKTKNGCNTFMISMTIQTYQFFIFWSNSSHSIGKQHLDIHDPSSLSSWLPI